MKVMTKEAVERASEAVRERLTGMVYLSERHNVTSVLMYDDSHGEVFLCPVALQAGNLNYNGVLISLEPKVTDSCRALIEFTEIPEHLSASDDGSG